MTIVRYTCTQCGLLTRVMQGENHVACGCNAPYTEEIEPDEQAEGGE